MSAHARWLATLVDNKVAVLILQHPQEQDRVLGTAGLLASMLGNATLSVGLSWRNLGHALGEPAEAKNWGVLYLGSAQRRAPAKGRPADRARPQGRSRSPTRRSARRGLEGHRRPRRQLGAGQGPVVAQRLADPAAPLRRGA